jgi:hypothetical protein
MSDPVILILDEATASVDNETGLYQKKNGGQKEAGGEYRREGRGQKGRRAVRRAGGQEAGRRGQAGGQEASRRGQEKRTAAF